ncbi:unnamed protein product [Triticum turgidum subsp. durum]|uniref:Receptor kinase-like protein Xa21 n=1 Tax=Triticum turgidum subsp. durum TaxID=4567 RepID=A0A9R1Q4E7_TRITD|nr:unnamed protein product [Triticum turgidum subsp. durum]
MSPAPLIIIVLSSLLTCSLLGASATALHDHGDASTDFQALRCLKLHLSTSGFLPSWKIDGSLQKFCTWSGVTCSKRHTSRVVALDLESLYLDGQMPPCIANLTLLTRIHLPNNQLRGPIPTELGQLNMLRYLNLSSNNLSGMIPSTLSSCSQLRVIDLGSNSFSGEIPPNLSQCPNMQQLKLDYNMLIGGIPEGLGILRNLSVLHLAGNTLTGNIPRSLGTSPALHSVNLTDNSLIGPIPSLLANSSSLQFLVLTKNQLGGEIPSALFNSTSLKILSLGVNNFIGSIPTVFPNFDDSPLQHLVLASNNLAGAIPSTLGNFSSLRWLLLSQNNFQGSIPASIGKLPNLQLLDLSYNLEVLLLRTNKISGTIPKEIEHLTNIKRLYMENNLLTGSIPKSLGNLEDLIELSLSQNKLSGQIPLSIGSLSQLSELYLQENNLSGPIPRILADCKNLEILNLSSNRFDDSIPKELLTLSSLSKGLDLSHNKLSGQIPHEIGSLLNLGPLNISNNQLSGEIPSTLGECVHLESLHMEGNNFHGRIPQNFLNLRGIIVMDLSRNNLSGEIPNFFESFSSMKLLNLSFNNLEGPVPPGGMFQNGSEVFIQGNKKLCANTPLLELPLCNGVKYKQKMHISKILKIVAITALSLVLSSCFGVIIFKRRKKIEQAAHPSIKELKKLTYADLVKATNGFSLTNLVGSGKYGSVYKGRIDSEDHIVAIKVFKLGQLGATKSFLAECEALRNTRHRNLVRVITVCSTSDTTGNEFKALILEFMENGDLESWLYPTLLHKNHPKRPLCLGSRIVVAVDIATALDYLHNHCMPPVVHCDLKPRNILLDDVMGAHVGDFGLAKFLHGYSSSSGTAGSTSTSLVGPRGSVGYIAPEYGYGSKISTEGDVYSYGIIILEMLTGKRPTDEMFKDGLSLYKFVEDSFPEKIGEILDPRMIIPYYGNQDEEEAGSSSDQENHQMAAGIMGCITALTKLGLLCAAETPKDRPAMQDVCVTATAIKEAFSALQA